MPVDRDAMLNVDLWVILWSPAPAVDAAVVEAVLDEHLAWMLDGEAAGRVVASGPLTAGPLARPGAGMTVLRATDEDDAADFARQDPFYRKGIRTFDVHRWRVMEGSVTVRVSFGTGTYGIA
ncbi:YciI family protein [Kineosporia sp. A_224]|uniref:YciI family protein n=1 Tax=Kineosporia sp. A_224 TaxID=1962180 RepID=UPI000B4B2CD0|nr:YciI family protein [Kineosporia sp. A_224]